MNYQTELLNQRQPTSLPNFGYGAGDGIVYVGGGKYWPMIVAGIRMLRDTGCRLPVEIWYRGRCEEVYPEDVTRYDVELFDLDRIGARLGDNRIPTGRVCQGGWEAKLYSIYHTNFDRILFLDADAYCIENPTPLFDLLEQTAFAYWKDLPHQEFTIQWPDVFPGGKEIGVPPIQGGQLLIDRIKARNLIHICNWMCQHSEYFFKKMYGDQDTWRVGLAMGLAEYGVVNTAQWKYGMMFDCSHNGVSYIYHRCGGKLFEPKFTPVGKPQYSNPNYDVPKEKELFTHFANVVNSRQNTAGEVFSEIYKKRLWGPEAKSGSGSTLIEARPFVDMVNRLMRKYKWNTVLDLGCGDGFVGSMLECGGYIGVDCEQSVIDECKIKYPKNDYYCLDFLENSDIIYDSDVLLIKDVLHHWPKADIVRFLDTLIESKKYKAIIVITDCQQHSNEQDCHLGGYRALSFSMSPLNKYQFTNVASIRNKRLGVLTLR